MNLEELRNMSKTDLVMDETELDIESLKTPQLHNKYLIFYTDEKLILGKMKSDLYRLKKDKWLYYTGKMSQEELNEMDWEPFSLNILKTDIDKFTNADNDIILLNNKILLQQEKVDYLESIIKIVNNRQWNIRSAIDWIKFTNGS
jgi:hypothetical protein|tara:strand:- start:1725 stop:2159 length:435 start_codon:yes stop_codon:yes gene_type:complete